MNLHKTLWCMETLTLHERVTLDPLNITHKILQQATVITEHWCQLEVCFWGKKKALCSRKLVVTKLVVGGTQYTLSPAYKEFGYNKHPDTKSK